MLAEVGGITLSTTSIWRRMQTWGSRIATAIQAEQAQEKAAAREWSTPGTRSVAQGPMGIAIDGAMLHLVDEGWKEFKLGCVFDVELAATVDKHTGDRVEYGHAVNCSYVVHLGGPAALGWKAWTEAQRRGWYAARDSIVLGDGAPWIWNLRDEHFPYSETLVDWYHATEHLGEATQLLYPEGGVTATRWYNRHEKLLYAGHANQVAQHLNTAQANADDPLHAEALRKAAGYFTNNQRRMAYLDLRNQGWPIGSGMVESGAKQFKMRVTGPGMRWSRTGAENVLAVRAAIMTSKARFDDLWCRAFANNSPPS